MQIVLATSNAHKVEEINAITKEFGIEFILPPKEFNPIENGNTFAENSLIKAKEANRLTNKMTLADDSGLCVDYLDGAPGIMSARYSDTPQNRINKLLNELKNVPIEKRSAKFVCHITLLDENANILFSDFGEIKGHIGFEVKGEHGFGYDPIFVVENNTHTMAELPDSEKNTISHRARAIKKLLNFLSDLK